MEQRFYTRHRRFAQPDAREDARGRARAHFSFLQLEDGAGDHARIARGPRQLKQWQQKEVKILLQGGRPSAPRTVTAQGHERHEAHELFTGSIRLQMEGDL